MVGLASASEEYVGDSARVKWSSWVRRQADEQKYVPLVCRSQDKQKSPRTKSMLSVRLEESTAGRLLGRPRRMNWR